MLILPDKKMSPLSRLARHLSSSAFGNARYFIVVDENSYNNCLAAVISAVPALQEAEFIEVPDGEECKDIDIVKEVWASLLQSGADRHSVLVALGGGAVCDFTGFVASTYMRGIRHINIPTTLTAMVDAAIGGKTAINIGGVKNVVGSFYQPSCVCVDTCFLDTLTEEYLSAGVVEMLKTFIVCVPQEVDIAKLLGSDWHDMLSPAYISLVAKLKESVVRNDFKDASVRRILNFGHTFGHAIEGFSFLEGHAPISHGHSVALGMRYALYLSTKKLGLSAEWYKCYCAWQQSVIATPHYSLRDTETLLSFMRVDKKNQDGMINAVLISSPGEAVIDLPLSEEEIRDAFLSAND